MAVERLYDEKMGRGRRRSDPARIAVAQVTGTVERYALLRRATADEAKSEIEASLAKLSDRQRVLDDAAASVVAERYAWESVALDLLCELGADRAAALAIHADGLAQVQMLDEVADRANSDRQPE
jgi:hypothetical protein